MNIRQGLIAKTAGMMGIGALAALISLPGFAQVRYNTKPNSETSNPTSPAPSAGTATTDPAYGNPVNQSPIRESRNPMGQMDGSTGGPSTVPGQRQPGASETPSGSPSVPGTSRVDDPGRATDGSSVDRPGVSQNGSTRSTERDAMQNNGLGNRGPSTTPTEAVPGASETPSGSPSVPGTSGVDDPGNSRLSPGVSRDALDNSGGRDSMGNTRRNQNTQPGPSTVPGQGQPGASETPSGSPSVPGNSGVDNPAQSK